MENTGGAPSTGLVAALAGALPAHEALCSQRPRRPQRTGNQTVVGNLPFSLSATRSGFRVTGNRAECI